MAALSSQPPLVSGPSACASRDASECLHGASIDGNIYLQILVTFVFVRDFVFVSGGLLKVCGSFKGMRQVPQASAPQEE